MPVSGSGGGVALPSYRQAGAWADEEHGRDGAGASACVEDAGDGEVEVAGRLHGLHGAAGHTLATTMKRAAFQGAP